MTDEDDRDAGHSFAERLATARNRQGMDAPQLAPSQRDASAMSVGLRMGAELLSSLVVALAIGWGLDRWLHTRPIFLCIFLLLGGAAGVLNVWRGMAPNGNKRTE